MEGKRMKTKLTILAMLLLSFLPIAEASFDGEGLEHMMTFPSLSSLGVGSVTFTSGLPGGPYVVAEQSSGLSVWSIQAGNILTFESALAPSYTTSSTSGTLRFTGGRGGYDLIDCPGVGSANLHGFSIDINGDITETSTPSIGDQLECDQNTAGDRFSFTEDYIVFVNSTAPYIHMCEQLPPDDVLCDDAELDPGVFAGTPAFAMSASATANAIAVRKDANVSIWVPPVSGTTWTWAAGYTVTGSGSTSEADLQWSSDGRYLSVMTPNQSPAWEILSWDPDASTLTQLETQTEEAEVQFSSDGYIGLASGSGCSAPCEFEFYENIYTDLSGITIPANITQNANDLSFGDTDYVFVGLDASPWLSGYLRSDDRIQRIRNGIIDSPLGVVNEARSSVNGSFTAFAHATSPFISIFNTTNYPYYRVSNPAILPASTGNGVAWGNDDEFLAEAHATTPFVTIYARVGDNFGKLSNPATLPAGTGNGVDFNPNNASHLAVGHVGSPTITVYERSGTTFTKLSNPASLPAGTVNAVAWSTNGTMLATGGLGTPSLAFYYLDGSTLVKQTAPSVAPNGTVNSLHWSSNDTLVVGHTLAPFVSTYTFQGGVYQKSPDVVGGLNSLSRTNVHWNPEGNGFAATTTASGGVPALNVYEWNQSNLTAWKVTSYEMPNAGSSSVSWFSDTEFVNMTHLAVTADTATAFWYNTTFGTPPPPLIIDLLSVVCTQNQAVLVWTEAANAVGYNVTRTGPNGHSFILGNVLTYTDTVTFSGNYSWTVSAWNGELGTGPQSNSVSCVLTIPPLFDGLIDEAALSAAFFDSTSDAAIAAAKFIFGLLFVIAISYGAGRVGGYWGAILGAIGSSILMAVVEWWPAWLLVFLLVTIMGIGLLFARRG